MEAMARHRTHSVAFKRQVAQEFLAGETLHELAKRHDLSRNLIVTGRWRPVTPNALSPRKRRPTLGWL